MTVQTGELRRRLDVPPDLVSDALLDTWLSWAAEQVAPWLVVDAATLYPFSVDEFTYQVAVKGWDTQARGTVSMDAVGEFTMPSPSATAGMIRGSFGAAGPALAMGGLSV